MRRYLLSFIITSLLYVSAIASVVYMLNSDKNYDDKNVKAEKIQKVNFTIITQEEKPTVVKKKSKPKPKIIKKKILKIPEPEQKPIKEQKKQEEIKEPQKFQEKIVKKQVVSTNTTDKKVCADKVKAKKELFITNLIKKINSNKFYPHTARRRGIEGSIEVGFNILIDGSVDNINMISGKKIFKKSAISAISKSFPVDVDLALFDFPKKFHIKIAYILR